VARPKGKMPPEEKEVTAIKSIVRNHQAETLDVVATKKYGVGLLSGSAPKPARSKPLEDENLMGRTN